VAKDSQRKGSLTANIHAFIQAAFSIRDLWSQDTWRSVDNIQRRWQQRVINSEINIEQLQSNLDDLITGIVAFTGLTSESMTREAAWLISTWPQTGTCQALIAYSAQHWRYDTKIPCKIRYLRLSWFQLTA
jgi:uncharacterized alpha-E superfamily protein